MIPKRPASLSGSTRKHIRAYFAAHDGHLPPDGLYDRVIGEIEHILIKETLKFSKHNQIKTAKILGINRNTLKKKIELYEIPLPNPPRPRRKKKKSLR